MSEKIPERFRFFFRMRGAIMVPPLLFALFCTWGQFENKTVLFLLGGCVFCAGWFVRICSQMHLHYRLPQKKILTRTGPYRYTRNPFYIGNTVIILAACIFSGLLWLIPIMLIYCAVVYSLVVRYEESHLRNKYGTPYEEYLAQVPRWFPRMREGHGEDSPGALRYFWPAFKTELHNIVLILPFIAKQIFF
jgi:protein-S-isoprenylcysteine O-methyltransferase Ste14